MTLNIEFASDWDLDGPCIMLKSFNVVKRRRKGLTQGPLANCRCGTRRVHYPMAVAVETGMSLPIDGTNDTADSAMRTEEASERGGLEELVSWRGAQSPPVSNGSFPSQTQEEWELCVP